MHEATWVLIRGMMSEAYHWREFTQLLQTRFPQDRVLTADILGSGPTSGEFTPVTALANLHALRAQVPKDGKKILVGFSLGGMLALEWAFQMPSEVLAVAAINTSLGNSPVLERMTPFAVGQIARAFFEPSAVRRERIVLELNTALCEAKLEALSEDWARRRHECPVHPLNFFRQATLALQFALRAEAPRAPTVLFSSACDRLVRPECSRRIAEAWRVPHFEHPRAGHDLALDDPEWLVEHLAQKVRPRLSLPLETESPCL